MECQKCGRIMKPEVCSWHDDEICCGDDKAERENYGLAILKYKKFKKAEQKVPGLLIISCEKIRSLCCGRLGVRNPALLQVLSFQVADDGFSSFFTLVGGLGSSLRTENSITAGKYPIH
jgi:hypothetical protein